VVSDEHDEPTRPEADRTELLTHREHDLPPEQTQDAEPEGDEAKLRRRKIWRRARLTCYALAAAAVIVPAIAFVITYFVVTVPDSETVAATQSQTVTLLYSDGTKMVDITPNGGSRTMITYERIPDVVKHAVYAAEDATFEENVGFDPTSIVRAVWIQLTGGQSGGSGITQQYIKQATGKDQATLGRKWTELVTAVKMNQEKTKPEILTAYLNTIYLGRGAYGIKAAAQAYFGKDIKDLNVSEAAQIAGMIQGPSLTEKDTYRAKRWNDVMTQLVDKGWLSAGDRAQYPAPPKLIDRDKARPTTLDGPRRAIQDQVMQELAGPVFGLSEDQVQRQGLKIYTTIDHRAQGSRRTCDRLSSR
jgi:membrane peptidoglycan carboxypeptidase